MFKHNLFTTSYLLALAMQSHASPFHICLESSDIKFMTTPKPTATPPPVGGSNPALQAPSFGPVSGEYVYELSYVNDYATIAFEEAALSSKATSISSLLHSFSLSTLASEVTASAGLYTVLAHNITSASTQPAGRYSTTVPKVTPSLCVPVASTRTQTMVFANTTRTGPMATGGKITPHAVASVPQGAAGRIITTTISGVALPIIQTFNNPPPLASAVASAKGSGGITSAPKSTGASMLPTPTTGGSIAAGTPSSAPATQACAYHMLNGQRLAVDSKGQYVVMLRDPLGLSSIYDSVSASQHNGTTHRGDLQARGSYMLSVGSIWSLL